MVDKRTPNKKKLLPRPAWLESWEIGVSLSFSLAQKQIDTGFPFPYLRNAL